VTLGIWLRATWYGWLLGVPLIVVLALVGEALGIGGSQVLVGLGMGTGIGLLQGRAIRPLLPRPAAWRASCIVGLALPFLVTDLAPAVGRELPYSLPLAVALGGLLIGVWQAFLLRPHVQAPGWWILANGVGWTLAAGMALLADSWVRGQAIRGVPGALLYLGLVAGGGLILGLVTGVVLPRLLRPIKR
jgi:hypothetical protein